MSKLGYIQESYGKQFNVSIANTYSFNVMNNAENLPVNTLIITSNIDDNGYDTGSYSLIVTDPYGTPVRLTYSVKEGNGLHYSPETDTLNFEIDNDTLVYTEQGLTFNPDKHLGSILKRKDNNIYIEEESLPTSSFNILGTAYIDEKTIKIDDGKIYVDTSALRYANNATNEYGIVIGDNKTIYINNGIISVNIDNFDKATEENYGFIQGDGYTVNVESGIVSVITENLEKATENTKGISKPNGKEIFINDNGKLTVNEDSLETAGTGNYGIARIDANTIDISEDNILSVKNYQYLIDSINEYQGIYKIYKQKLDDYIQYLSEGNILLKNKNIMLFAINETSTIELEKPKENEEVINMPEQYITAVFDVITTCDFILNISFEEGTNEFPNVELFEVNYNDEVTYSKTEALNPDTVYASTKGELKKFTIKFLAKNFRNTVRNNYVITSADLMIANSEDHNKNLTQKFSIVRYNSIYHEEERETKYEAYYILVQDSVQWAFSLSDTNLYG